VNTEVGTSKARKFGFTVGLAFGVLGAVSAWRGRTSVAAVLATVGGSLFIAALIVPSLLQPVERAWMRMARAMSRVTTPILVTVMFVGVITPIGMVMRALGRNPLARAKGESLWIDRGEARRSDLRRQF
jgi:hypothetical protein